MTTARVCNIALALACVCNIIDIAHNWYAGNPADWFVWSSAIYAGVVVFGWCVRDAIRGVW